MLLAVCYTILELTHLEDISRVWAEADLIYSSDEVSVALDHMAIDMTAKLRDKNPLFLVVMVGGVVPAGLLLPRLSFPLQIDYVHATRYAGATAGGKLHWLRKPEIDMAGRSIVILDDVLDEGLTLAAIVDYCLAAGANEVSTAVVVTKDVPRSNEGLSHANYSALHADNRYLFGCGMDYKTYLRNANGIYAVKLHE